MAIIYTCFTCGSPDHIKAECPKRTRGRAAPPAPRLSPEAEDRERTVPSPRLPLHCHRCGVRLDYAASHHPTCGLASASPERIAEIIDAAGLDHSGVVRTEFRTANRMTGRTEAQLRELARTQAAEARLREQDTPW